MQHKTKSIRPFIGSKNYAVSRAFYSDLGFEEVILSAKMCLFKTDEIGFYLQDAFVKDWIDNTMIFIEVADVNSYYQELLTLNLSSRYEGVKLIPVKNLDWGSEFFLHDPSGILWHFGQFN